jgi:hypothetical protein
LEPAGQHEYVVRGVERLVGAGSKFSFTLRRAQEKEGGTESKSGKKREGTGRGGKEPIRVQSEDGGRPGGAT